MAMSNDTPVLPMTNAHGHTAICQACDATRKYVTEELAQAAAVEHVFRVHPDLYRAACCGNDRHGILCDGRHA